MLRNATQRPRFMAGKYVPFLVAVISCLLGGQTGQSGTAPLDDLSKIANFCFIRGPRPWEALCLLRL